MKFSVFSILVSFLLLSCSADKKTVESTEIDSIFDQYNVNGCFILVDVNNNRIYQHNSQLLDSAFTPASTFKIPNTFISLETGVIKSASDVIPWDGIKRNNVWDKDHTLKKAYENSTVWFYQTLARRIGGDQMQSWVDSLSYGNRSIKGGIDVFWLTGDLRITPNQQIDFLQKLHNEQFPFSVNTYKEGKKIMIEKKEANFVLRSKTGWGTQGKNDIGWYVGYIEKGNELYFFANCLIENSDKMEEEKVAENFANSRKRVVFDILEYLKIM